MSRQNRRRLGPSPSARQHLPGKDDAGGDGELPERLLTVDQLADIWQVSARTIRRMIKQKRIPIVRIGRTIRIHPKVAAL
jgi:excisionase family DNA binding protein